MFGHLSGNPIRSCISLDPKPRHLTNAQNISKGSVVSCLAGKSQTAISKSSIPSSIFIRPTTAGPPFSMSFRSERPHRSSSTMNSGWDEQLDESWPRLLGVLSYGRWDAPRQDAWSDANTACSDRGDDDIPHRGDLPSGLARGAENEDRSDERLDWLARHIAVNLTLLFDDSDYEYRDLERQWHRIVEDAIYDAEAPTFGLDEYLDYMTRTYGVGRVMSDPWVSHWEHVPTS